jgi:hypothetical protein
MPVTMTLQLACATGSISSTSNATTALSSAASSLVPVPVRIRIWRPSNRKFTGSTLGSAPLLTPTRPRVAVASRRRQAENHDVALTAVSRAPSRRSPPTSRHDEYDED